MNDAYYTIQTPPDKSEWTVTALGHFSFTPGKAHTPSAFHRWMHEVFFGVKWSKTTTAASRSPQS